MSHPFQGIDPFSSTAPNPGYGQWTDGISTDDGDNRDAASANLNAEAAHNRTNWLRYRMINQLEGGIYVSTQPIILQNPWKTLNRFERVGTAAWEAQRAPLHINSGGGNLTCTDSDTWIVDQVTDGATHTYTFVVPGSNVPPLYKFRVRQQTTGATYANNGAVRFNLVNTTHYVFQFGIGNVLPFQPASVDVEYNSATGHFVVCGAFDPVGGIVTYP
jgi:hypothetical protein